MTANTAVLRKGRHRGAARDKNVAAAAAAAAAAARLRRGGVGWGLQEKGRAAAERGILSFSRFLTMESCMMK